MWGDFSKDQLDTALDATAEELLWEAGIPQGPVDAFVVARRIGIKVAEAPQGTHRAQFLRVAGEGAGTPVITLAEDDRHERRQFAVAHELGEFAAPRVFEHLRVDPRHLPITQRERIANQLAGRLLVPSRWLKEIGKEYQWDLPTLKDHFSTASHELIARRLLDMPPRVVVTLFDQGEVTWRRSNFAGQPGPLTGVEEQLWSDCHQLGVATTGILDEETTGGLVTVCCWPVHEEHWKREIMRSEVEGWD